MSETIIIGEGLAVVFNDNAPVIETRLFGRSAADHAAEKQPLHLGRIIGNRSREHAHPGTARAALHRLRDFRELRRLILLLDAAGGRPGEQESADGPALTDPVPDIRAAGGGRARSL